MTELGVTLDALAVLRESRGAREPDPVMAAYLAEQAGADAINVHLRTDRRHIQERDVHVLTETIGTELNLVVAPSQEMARFALTTKPHRVTFVPERMEELGAPLGIDVILNSSQLRQLVRMMNDAGIRCSLFVEPDLDQIKEAHRIDAQGVELSAEPFNTCRDEETREAELRRLTDAARLAAKFGLEVAVGRGLGLRALPRIAAIGPVRRVNVGYALVARAVLDGFAGAVREALGLVRGDAR